MSLNLMEKEFKKKMMDLNKEQKKLINNLEK